MARAGDAISRGPLRLHHVICLAGGGVMLMGLRLLSAGRLADVARGLDRRSGLFTTWGTGVYARFAPSLLGSFYERVASDVAAAVADGGAVLDVGTGPGSLALEIARRRPDLNIAGVDIAPSMLDMARANARRAGLDQRVRFELGEAALLSFADSSFDLVVSTLSVHHWSSLPSALIELARVLRPGGRLWLYDVAAVSYSLPRLSAALASTPFAGQSIDRTPVRVGRLPLPLYVRFALSRQEGAGSV